MKIDRLARTLLIVLGVLLTVGCSGPMDPSAPYFPTRRLETNPPPPIDPNFAGVALAKVVPRGAIARPDPGLTPGVVAQGSRDAVCQMPKHVRVPITAAQKQAIFTEYHIPPQQSRRYGLDYLIPLQLGGAPVLANIWPVATRGVGYHEKQSLNTRLRIDVCRGDLPLDLAQKQIAADWFSVWVKYG